MDDPLDVLNEIKQAFGADESYVVTNFEVLRRGVDLQVIVRDGGVSSGPQRYFVTVLKDGKFLAEAGPEPDLSTAMRSVHGQTKSHF